MSLGIDIVPLKTCTLSCVYCQVGKTPVTTIERREYIPAGKILKEVKERVEKGLKTDWLTFSGSGEPTLHSGIGELIKGIKAFTDIPICVITNGTLLWDPRVRNDIIEADAVMPSLDSAQEHTFRLICNPHQELHIEKVIEGLVQFRKEFSGKIWLEIMLIKGINDSREELERLREAVERIRPDSIQLNTVVRPPAVKSAQPVSGERLLEICDFFGDKAEIIASFESDSTDKSNCGIEDVLEYLKRRPGSLKDICTALGIEKHEAERMVERLEKDGKIILKEFYGKRFWEHIEKSQKYH